MSGIRETFHNIPQSDWDRIFKSKKEPELDDNGQPRLPRFIVVVGLLVEAQTKAEAIESTKELIEVEGSYFFQHGQPEITSIESVEAASCG